MHQLKPNYKNFKSVIEQLYPEKAALIAITDKATYKNAKPIKRDLENQIDPEVLSKFPKDKLDYIFGFMNLVAKTSRRLKTTYADSTIFFREAYEQPDDKSTKSDVEYSIKGLETQFVYIAIDNRQTNPRDFFHSCSSVEIPELRMKFNQEAMNPDICKWYVFFHELCHALIALDVHDYPKDDAQTKTEFLYYKEMEESVCDAYAISKVLEMYGDSALAFAHTFADMRLSRFYRKGHNYYTAPAIYAIEEKYKSGELQELFGNDKQIYASALQVALDNYVELDSFANAYEKIDALEDIDPITWLFNGPILYQNILDIISENYGYEDQEKLSEYQQTLKDYITYSRFILKEEYEEEEWTAKWQTLKRFVQTPLHKVGLAPHPGY